MLRLHVIEVKGTFAGAAIDDSDVFRFVAVDARVKQLDGSEWPTLPDLRRVVGHLLATGHMPAQAGP